MRNLTLERKITIFKTLTIFKIMQNASVTVSPSSANNQPSKIHKECILNNKKQ